jgi:hypothetical protein
MRRSSVLVRVHIIAPRVGASAKCVCVQTVRGQLVDRGLDRTSQRRRASALRSAAPVSMPTGHLHEAGQQLLPLRGAARDPSNKLLDGRLRRRPRSDPWKRRRRLTGADGDCGNAAESRHRRSTRQSRHHGYIQRSDVSDQWRSELHCDLRLTLHPPGGNRRTERQRHHRHLHIGRRHLRAVEAYLISQGQIAPERLTIIGYGDSRPEEYETAPSDINSDAARANMRVRFEVIVD